MGRISTCQQNLIDRLNADSFFVTPADPGATPPTPAVVNVPIIFKKQGDIESQLDEKLASLGVGLIVILRSGRLLEADSLELALVCQFALSAVYNPTVADDAAPTAYDIAEKAAQLLHGRFNNAASGDQTEPSRFMVDRNAIAPLPPTKDKAFLDIQLMLVNTVISLSP